jgi:two-component system response regulator DesR
VTSRSSAEASREDKVLSATLDALPDVAFLDIEMPGGDGLSTTMALWDELPSCRVIVLATFGRARRVPQACLAERRSGRPLSRKPPASQLASTTRRVMNGERVVDSGLAAARAEGNNSLTAP